MWPRKCGAPQAEPTSGGRMGSRNLTEAAPSLRRGGSDSTAARTCRATGEALLAPVRNRRSRVDRITGATGESIEDARVAVGSVVATKRKGALLLVASPTIRKART